MGLRDEIQEKGREMWSVRKIQPAAAGFEDEEGNGDLSSTDRRASILPTTQNEQQ